MLQIEAHFNIFPTLWCKLKILFHWEEIGIHSTCIFLTSVHATVQPNFKAYQNLLEKLKLVQNINNNNKAKENKMKQNKIKELQFHNCPPGAGTKGKGISINTQFKMLIFTPSLNIFTARLKKDTVMNCSFSNTSYDLKVFRQSFLFN